MSPRLRLGLGVVVGFALGLGTAAVSGQSQERPPHMITEVKGTLAEIDKGSGRDLKPCFLQVGDERTTLNPTDLNLSPEVGRYQFHTHFKLNNQPVIIAFKTYD